MQVMTVVDGKISETSEFLAMYASVKNQPKPQAGRGQCSYTIQVRRDSIEYLLSGRAGKHLNKCAGIVGFHCRPDLQNPWLRAQRANLRGTPSLRNLACPPGGSL